MKEFRDNDGTYKHIKPDQAKERAFFAALVKVIRDHARYCTQATVILDDLKKFNGDHNLFLEPFPGRSRCRDGRA
jgi:hypothetical protein